MLSSALAQLPASTKGDVWGKSPPASDDRFSNPKSKLYAGPNGWFNTGEVRATLEKASESAYTYQASFRSITGGIVAVKELQTLFFDFGDLKGPLAPGTYTIGTTGNASKKVVRLSFSDTGGQQLKEWSAESGAGTLSVENVEGFTIFTCRNVLLQPTGLHNKGKFQKVLTLGFEGALVRE